jgi:hypothetical protein
VVRSFGYGYIRMMWCVSLSTVPAGIVLFFMVFAMPPLASGLLALGVHLYVVGLEELCKVRAVPRGVTSQCKGRFIVDGAFPHSWICR